MSVQVLNETPQRKYVTVRAAPAELLPFLIDRINVGCEINHISMGDGVFFVAGVTYPWTVKVSA